MDPFVDWNGPYDDELEQEPAAPVWGDRNTAWRPGPGRSLEDVAAALRDEDPHARELDDTSEASAPTGEDGAQPWDEPA